MEQINNCSATELCMLQTQRDPNPYTKIHMFYPGSILVQKDVEMNSKVTCIILKPKMF